MENDPRPIHVKIVNGHLVTVYPPGPQQHDEVAWRFPKAGAHHGLLRRVATPEGLEDLITTYEREETIDDDI